MSAKKVVNKFNGFFILAAALFLCLGAAEPECIQWEELKGTHFIVYFTGDQERFVRDILHKAEYHYGRIASELGYPRYKEFWLWENRCKIYIYPDKISYLRATGQPDWSEGMAEYRTRKIYSYIGSVNFLDSLLPHETAHLVFRDFVGFVSDIPLWLDEGVAQWEEEAKRPDMKKTAKYLYEQSGMLAIEDMMRLNMRILSQKDRVYVRAALRKDRKPGVVFLSTTNLVHTYYLQSVSLVGFLIEKYGGSLFVVFCRELRDGKSLEDALRSAYPNITSLEDFQDRWREYLDEL